MTDSYYKEKLPKRVVNIVQTDSESLKYAIFESTSDDNFATERKLAEFTGYIAELRAKTWLRSLEQQLSDEKYRKENLDSEYLPPSIPDD